MEALPRADVVVVAEAAPAYLMHSLSGLGKPILDCTSLLMAEIGRRLAPSIPTV